MTEEFKPGVAIIGCGLIGQKRARALNGARLVVCSDLVLAKAQVIAGLNGAEAVEDWRLAVTHPDVSIVMVATFNQSLVEISLMAAQYGKHILVEKPAARNCAELDQLIEAAQKNDVRVRVGFNHRYHPAFLKARQLIDAGELGELMFIRGRYGHGGRPGYDREWRAKPELSGGGELIDQGVHLIDLSRLILGNFTHIIGICLSKIMVLCC
jgi:predicted dehydrogenase